MLDKILATAALASAALFLAACQGPSSPSDDGAGDGPVRSLTDEERSELETNGTVLATWEEPDGVVVALGYGSGDGVGVELVGVPEGFLTGGSFGGSGELLLPEDVCNFQTADDGWTVVLTNDTSATVTVEGSGGRYAVEDASAVSVGNRTVGVVLVEVGHTEYSPRPSIDRRGTC